MSDCSECDGSGCVFCEVVRLRAEVERLTRELQELRSTTRKVADTSVRWQDRALEAEAEVKRLRKALNEAADALSKVDCAEDCVDGDLCKSCKNWINACEALSA